HHAPPRPRGVSCPPPRRGRAGPPPSPSGFLCRTARPVESRNVDGRIAYQGEPGSNSSMACDEMLPSREQLACTTFEDALEAVTNGTAALAMIPIDNSIAGRVADIHHLLPESGLHIVGEPFLPIH